MCLNLREQLSDCLGFSRGESGHCCAVLCCFWTSQLIPNSGVVRKWAEGENRFRSKSPADSPHAGPPPTSFSRQSFKVHLHRVCWWGQGRWGTSPTKRTRLITTDPLCKPDALCPWHRQKQTRSSFSGSQDVITASFWNWKPESRRSCLGFAIMQDNPFSPGIEEEEAQSAFVRSSLWVSCSVPIFYKYCYYC